MQDPSTSSPEMVPLYVWGANTTNYGAAWGVFNRRGEVIALCPEVLTCHRIVAALNEWGKRPIPGSVPVRES